MAAFYSNPGEKISSEEVSMNLPDNQEKSPSLSETELLSASETLQYSRRQFLKMAAMISGGAVALRSLSGLTAQADASVSPETFRKVSPKSNRSGQNPLSHPSQQESLKKTSTMDKAYEEILADYNPKTMVEPRKFDYLYGKVQGISENQLKQHFALYEGYVKKVNQIQDQLQTFTPADLTTMNATFSPFRELHVEQSYALNGVTLHEKYFENLDGAGAQPSSWLNSLISKEFGSMDVYVNHLKALGKSMRGWAVSALNLRDGRIHNYGLDLHNQLVPMDVYPILVLDVYEHTYMIDYGTNRGAYLETFFGNVNWPLVEKRAKLAIAHHETHWMKPGGA